MNLPPLSSTKSSRSHPEQITTPGSSEKKDTLRSYPFWLASALILLSGFMLAAALYVLRLQAIENGERLRASFAQVVQEQTTRSFQGVEQRLYLAKSELRRLRDSKTLTESSARMTMKEQIRTSAFLSAMFVLNPLGQVVYESDEGISGRLVTLREHFLKYLGEPREGFRIALPVQGKTTGRWRIAASIPWSKDDGSYAGQIVAVIELPYFEKVWGDVDLGTDGTIQLFRRDGFLMIRSPHLDKVIGTNYSERPFFRDMILKGPNGRFESTSMVDGVARIFTYRSLSAQPDLFVLVGQSMSTILAPWRKWSSLAIALWVVAVLVITGLGKYLNGAWLEKRNVEIEARKMAQRLAMATESAGIGVYDWNRNRGLTYMSPTFFSMLGQDPGQARYVWKEAIESVHPDDREAVAAKIRSTFNERALQFQYEVRLKHTNGSYRWIHGAGRVIEYGQDGKPERVIGVRIDVTERRQAEEDRLKILERITDGFIALDKQWRYTYVNRKAARLLNRTPESLLGKYVWTDFPEGIGGWIRRSYEQAMAEQKPTRIEEYFPSYERWFENSIYPSAEGLSIYFHDITDRKMAEQAAQSSAKRLRDLIDGLGPAIFVGLTTPDGVLLEANRPALEAAGLTLDAVVGRPLDETFGLNGSEATRLQIRTAVERGARGEATRHDMQIRGLGDQLMAVDFSMQPILNEAGEVVFLVPSAQVITEREQALNALRDSIVQLHTLSGKVLEAQESERRRIARELHDELGQSLTALKINLLSRERTKDLSSPELDIENIQIVENTLQQVRRLALGLRPSVLDDFGLVPALNWLAEQSKSRGDFVIEIQAPEDLGRFSPDIETCCFRVVQEALTNIVRHAEASLVKILLYQNASQLILEVTDDGLGFDFSEMRARAALGKSFGILGMQERAMLIGGHLNIDTSHGEGCTVRMSVDSSISASRV
jgi:PAS domain S-box-containing protein